VGFGYLSDRLLSRRLPFTLGLALLGSATILFALAQTLALVLIARFFQGLATAIAFTVGFALLFDKVGSENLGQAMGYTSMSLSLGWFLGPVVGGVVYKRWGYFSVFALPLVLVAVEIVLRLLVVEEERGKAPIVVVTDVEAGDEAVRDGINDETRPLLSRKGPAKSVHRNAILVLLSSPRFMVGMFGFCVLNAFMVAFDGVLPVYVKELFGFDSKQVSLTFLALTVPMLLSPVFGSLVDRMGSTKWPAVAGLLLTIPGLVLLRLVQQNTKKDLVVLILLLIELGIAFAVGLPPLAAEVMHVVDEIEEKNPGIFGPHGACAQAYGLTNAGLGIGCVLGPLGAGFIRVNYGWSVAVTSMAVLSGIAIIFVLPVTGGSLWKMRRASGGASTERIRRS
jgi:MFS family permease